MSQYFGKRSEYEYENASYYLIICVSYLVFLFLLLLVVYYFYFQSHFNLTLFFIFISGYGIIALVIHYLLSPIEHEFYCFVKGLVGEKEIRFLLRRLPDDYAVYENVKIPNYRGNIDFVVAGPTGVFSIEVKNYEGYIGFDGTELTQNGHVFKEGDFLKQTNTENILLHDYLFKSCKAQISVYPILVFSSKDYLHFETEYVKDIKVLGKLSLLRYIKSKSASQYPVSREKIQGKLKELVHN